MKVNKKIKGYPMWQPPTNFIINISRQAGGGC